MTRRPTAAPRLAMLGLFGEVFEKRGRLADDDLAAHPEGRMQRVGAAQP